MSELSIILSLCFGLALVLDLVTVAAKAGFINTNLARIHAQPNYKDAQMDRVTRLSSSAASTRSSLYLALGVYRFLLAGLTIILLAPLVQQGEAIWIMIGILLAGAVFLSIIEWMVEERVAQEPEKWTIRLAQYTRFLTILLYPVLYIPLKFVARSNGADGSTSPVTEDDLMTMVDAGQEEGLLEQEERKMIYSIFQLGDTIAREIMIPRIDIVALDVQLPLSEAIDPLITSGFSRVPVYAETVDNIQGLLYTKDMLRLWKEGAEHLSLRDLLRPAHFVPEAKKVDELLGEMQSRRVHMAIIVDEYGGVAGLVTMEDIVEEIIGEIRDEFDQAEELPYQKLADGEYVFMGRIDLDDFNEIMGSHITKDDADTLGGYIYNRVGRVPSPEEILQVENLVLTIDQVIGRRIRKVRGRWAPAEDDATEEESHANG